MNESNTTAGRPKEGRSRTAKPRGGSRAGAQPAAAAAPARAGRGRPAGRAEGMRKQVKSGANTPPLNIYPLGGLGEVGKNITAYECNGDMILVDCGSLFPESDMYGIDLVIPDFTFLEQNRDKLRGVLITHGHEDHIGALPYLLREINVPVYATRLTVGLIKNKLEEHGLLSSVTLNTIRPREKVKLGCFTVDPISVNHSIPDAVAFAMECPAGIVVQTGDFKIDYTPIGGEVIDLATFAEYGKKGVLVMLSDSTNSERPGMTISERKVNEGLHNLFARVGRQRIIVASFASNLYRIQQIIDLAVQYKRKVAVSGRSMLKNTEMALELGYLHAPENVFIDMEKINKYPPEAVVVITTGSQGEPLSALARMASGSHRNLKVGPDDFIIISATPIPGNEKMVTKVVNSLLKLGCEVIYERMYEVHASGHACQEEQKLLLDLVQPKFFVPVHGEYKHLKRHAMTAESLGIPSKNIMIADTGDRIHITGKSIDNNESVPAGAVLVDGLGVGDVGSVVLRDRRLLSEDGIVVISAAIDTQSGELVSEPELFSRGFVYVKESEQLLEETRRAVRDVLLRATEEKHNDINSIKTRVREAASSILYRKTKRSPMILPIILDV